jgi:hypothetical protein
VTTADVSTAGGKGKKGKNKKKRSKSNKGKSGGEKADHGEKKENQTWGAKQGASGGRKGPLKCNLCQKEGHKMHQCEELSTAIAAVAASRGSVSVTLGAEKESGSPCCDDDVAYHHGTIFAVRAARQKKQGLELHLDNQATTGICKDKRMLHNLRQAEHSMEFSGITGDVMETSVEGDIIVDGITLATVWYHPKAQVNVVPFGSVETKFNVVYRRCKYDTVHLSDTVRLVFTKRLTDAKGNGLYACDMSKYASSENGVLGAVALSISAVAQNKSKYSKREVAEADQAMQLYSKLGYASSKDIDALLRSGGMMNCHHTAFRSMDVTSHL